MLASVVGLYVVSAQDGGPTYLLTDLAALDMDPTPQRWLFLGFFIAFAIKAPMFPVHTWLPDSGRDGDPPAPRCCWSACSTRSARSA